MFRSTPAARSLSPGSIPLLKGVSGDSSERRLPPGRERCDRSAVPVPDQPVPDEVPLPQERTQTTGTHRQGRPREVVPVPIGITFCLGPRRPSRWASACIKVPPIPGPRKTPNAKKPAPRAPCIRARDRGRGQKDPSRRSGRPQARKTPNAK